MSNPIQDFLESMERAAILYKTKTRLHEIGSEFPHMFDTDVSVNKGILIFFVGVTEGDSFATEMTKIHRIFSKYADPIEREVLNGLTIMEDIVELGKIDPKENDGKDIVMVLFNLKLIILNKIVDKVMVDLKKEFPNNAHYGTSGELIKISKKYMPKAEEFFKVEIEDRNQY